MVLANRAWVNTATTGTGTVTLGAAIAGYFTFAEAGVQDADVVSYCIKDGNDFEIGTGTYTASGTTLTRTVTESKIGGVVGASAINLSGNATVFITARAEDIVVKDGNNDVAGIRNLTQTGYQDLAEISEPSSPAANVARLFPRDVSGRTELAYKNSAGQVTDLLRGIVSIKDYGADPSETAANNTTFIQAALDSGFPEIVIPNGDYSINGTFTLPSTVTKIRSYGTITQTADAPIWYKAGTVPASGVAASSGISVGDRIVTFSDASSFSEDDWVLLRCNDLTPNVTAGSRISMLRRLTAADSTTIELDAAVYRAMTTDLTARIVSLGSRVVFEGGIYTSEDQTNTLELFHFLLCHAPDFVGVTIQDSGGSAIALSYCVGGNYDHSHIVNMLDDSGGGHFGYGVLLMGATRGFNFNSGSVGKVRHAITTATFQDNTGFPDANTLTALEFRGEPEACYYGPVYCYATTNAALDTHEQGFGITITPNVHGCFEGVLIRATDVNVQGGQIINTRRNAIRLDDPASNGAGNITLRAIVNGLYVNNVAQDGTGGTESRGIHCKPDDAELIVKNSQFIGFEQYGIQAVDGTTVHVSNCLFDGLAAASQTALQIETSNSTVEDCDIRNCNIGIVEASGQTGNLFQFNRFSGNSTNESRTPTYPMMQASRDVGTWYVLGKSAVAVSHTGDTNETTLATITVPANAMGPNGVVRITTLWSYTNSANNKVLRVRFGGTGGTIYLNTTKTTTASFRDQRQIANVNSASSQKGAPNGLGAGGWGDTTAGLATGAIDTTADVDILIRGTLANTGETITLEAYTVEVCHGA